MTGIKLAVLALALAGGAAQAATFKFTYTAVGGGILAGRLTGTLQGDANTVLVDGVPGLITYNGIAGPATPVLLTASTLYGEPRAPTVTFDGSILDFFAATDETYFTGVLFDPDIVDFQPLASTSFEFGDLREDYRLGAWTLTAVPEPGTWALMVLGFGLVGTFARRRSAVVTA